MTSSILYRMLDVSNVAEVSMVAEIHENAPKYWTHNYSAELQQIQQRIEQLKAMGSCIDRFFQIAEAHEEMIVGFHWLDIEKTNGDIFGHIKSLWVHKDYQHKGIASTLKKNGERWAKNKGIKYLKTTVHANNPRMIAFNLRFGYDQGFIEMMKQL